MFISFFKSSREHLQRLLEFNRNPWITEIDQVLLTFCRNLADSAAVSRNLPKLLSIDSAKFSNPSFRMPKFELVRLQAVAMARAPADRVPPRLEDSDLLPEGEGSVAWGFHVDKSRRGGSLFTLPACLRKNTCFGPKMNFSAQGKHGFV